MDVDVTTDKAPGHVLLDAELLLPAIIACARLPGPDSGGVQQVAAALRQAVPHVHRTSWMSCTWAPDNHTSLGVVQKRIYQVVEHPAHIRVRHDGRPCGQAGRVRGIWPCRLSACTSAAHAIPASQVATRRAGTALCHDVSNVKLHVQLSSLPYHRRQVVQRGRHEQDCEGALPLLESVLKVLMVPDSCFILFKRLHRDDFVCKFAALLVGHSQTDLT